MVSTAPGLRVVHGIHRGGRFFLVNIHRAAVLGSQVFPVRGSMGNESQSAGAEKTGRRVFSWIVPGRASWSWWSDSQSPRDYKKLVPFVNLAAEMGWEYSLVDAGWDRMVNGSVEDLIRYAGGKNVDLLLWYHSGSGRIPAGEEPRNLMWDREIRRAEFERISQLGVKGIKVDFFNSDKQQIITQYLGILEDAADYRLVVNFHGCTLPKGWRRTWPNLLTMESVRGGESYKFDAAFPEIAPSHLAVVPYTRNAVGPVDYTPCGFSDHTYPHLTTCGFELALPVLFESGIMHYMDTPEITSRLPGDVVEFLKNIPVVWDETRHLAGYPGKEVIIARRNGDRWYIGGINGENISKDFTLDLSLLGEVPDSACIFSDGATGREFLSEEIPVRENRITFQMQPFGGIAGYLY